MVKAYMYKHLEKERVEEELPSFSMLVMKCSAWKKNHEHLVATVIILLHEIFLSCPRREAMAARDGLSHLLDNFEDLRRPSFPSGLGPRFWSSSGWMDAAS